jgi:pimeloyl-ACP methyl ester carboxylesterase
MAGSAHTWRAVLPQLAKKYRVIAPDLIGHGQSSKPRTDYSLGAFAVGLRDLLDELGVASATVVGHSLGGGVAMQFLYQHPEYCRRLVLISSGGLGPDVGWILRLLAAPGAEFVMPVIAPAPVLRAGNAARSWFSSMGLRSPRGAEIWNAYSSFADRGTREAFIRTLRSVVDYRGQSVSALNRLNLREGLPVLAIWGEKDDIIPVDHAYSALQARPDCRLEILPNVGHFAQVEAPEVVVDLIDELISTTDPAEFER